MALPAHGKDFGFDYLTNSESPVQREGQGFGYGNEVRSMYSQRGFNADIAIKRLNLCSFRVYIQMFCSLC
jgi:hypothetical protein